MIKLYPVQAYLALPLVVAILGLAGCSAEAAAGSATSGTATAPAARTSGEVEMHGTKTKVAFSIELPDGLKDVSEEPSMKRYAKDAKSFDGYSFQVMEANEKWAAAGLDKVLEEALNSPDAKKNKATILDKAKTDDGWYFASTIDEGNKKAVLYFGIVIKGDTKLMCRGNVEGPLADEPEKAAAVIVKACRSLKVGA